MNTAGRAIVFAGGTVVIAMLALFALGVSMLYGAAVAAALAVLFVLAAALTLLPALLSFTGRRVGRVRRSHPDRPGLWRRWAGFVGRRPVQATVCSTAVVLVLATPLLGLRLGQPDAGNDPTTQTTRHAYDLLATGFGPGFNGPLLLAVQLPAAGDSSGLARITTTLEHTPGIASVATPQLNPARDTAAITAYPATSPQSTQTTSLVKRLRAHVLPPLQKTTHTTIHVGGVTASQIDFAHVIASQLPLFIGIVVLVSALVLLIVFRSLIIPIQAALMNLPRSARRSASWWRSSNAAGSGA